MLSEGDTFVEPTVVNIPVLILVLMEDALGDIVLNDGSVVDYDCLNPCFNGRCSRSFSSTRRYNRQSSVLILVLMEDALGDKTRQNVYRF